MADAASRSDALPAKAGTLERSLHVSVSARDRYQVAPTAFGTSGRLLLLDHAEAHRITAALNADRDRDRHPASRVQPGVLGAAVILHELMHAVMTMHTMGEVVLGALTDALGADGTDGALTLFLERFPPPHAAAGRDGARQYLASTDSDNRVAACEELVIHGLALDNPALTPLYELFDPGPLANEARYVGARGESFAALARTGAVSGTAAQDGGSSAPSPVPSGMSLLDLLATPQRRHPLSLFDQLSAALELWGSALAGRYAWLVAQALRGLDVLREERPAGPHVSGPPPRSPGWLSREGDGGTAYSVDREWMPRVALVAKNAFVWLEQLSRLHGRRIERLDQVPGSALDDLASAGFNALWLVGLWQRSTGSKTIKRLRGQPFAEASAYAIDEYRVADELGGEAALDALREQAWRRGIRLASDMVPNHTGLDARWVVEHPERFVQLDQPPFAGYTFDGPDVSGDPRVQVRIEDGYYDGSDAAVVYQVRDAGTGRVRYLYHGNDGTLMPWNDTAQLDYLRADVRAAVIDTIVDVARRFPIIRFDAAMTLVRRHVRRLWHPAPGEGGAIASRSRHALPEDVFDAAMPREFWREVVEAVAARAPDTLLLAEAFWLMESYFVRHLGMHRVYNSAFMHMLADEDTGAYRELLAETLAFDPRILERFVNYLTTPDEESARERFGTGDKYFGAAAVLATMPGLPLFGHGQVEGMGEKYGMEFRAPRLDEPPDTSLVERHAREIAPLLRDRASFSSAARFRLFAARSGEHGGAVAHSVLAYGFAADGSGATVVVFNDSASHVTCALIACEPFAALGASGEPGPSRSLPLLEALGLDGARDGSLEANLHPAGGVVAWDLDDLWSRGLVVDLAPYEYRVYRHLRPARVTAAVEAAPAPVDERQTGGGRGRRAPVRGGPYGAASRRAAARRRRGT